VYPIPKGDDVTERRRAAAERIGELIDAHGDAGHREALHELMRLPDLMGTAAVAERLGTTTANLRKWAGVPAPLYDLPAGKFYDVESIEAYAAARAKGAAA
jgi:hypothetical protein